MMRALLTTLIALLLLPPVFSQTSSTFLEVRRAEGTGNTTGHVATLTVKNIGNDAVDLAPATYYIPSDLVYQSYVARIEEEIFVAGNAVVEVRLYGYCADVSKPPARAGKQLTPFEQWVLIVPEGGTDAAKYALLPDRQRSAWPVGEVPRKSPFDIVASESERVNWAGTRVPVPGTIDPDKQPAETAALLVAYLQLVEAGATELRERGQLRTPFAPTPVKEYQSVVQHAYWMTLARLTGERYNKDDFAQKIRALTPAAAPENREKITSGINQLWAAFNAVCANASIF